MKAMEKKNGLEDYYVIRNNKKLRFGYTTGSCAAAACRGAAEMLLGGKEVSEIALMTPKGILLHLELQDVKIETNAVTCAVRKDGGDDPDVTDGLLIYARVEKTSSEERDSCKRDSGERDISDEKKIRESGIKNSRFRIAGGIGVGRVTKPGLNQPVGEAAINSVPRAMICRELENVAEKYDYEGDLQVTIYVPEGEKTAKKTFNPRLGIEGGISILGTTGIVEPMSEKALLESIRVEMKQHYAQGEEYLLVTPGNYGQEYLKEHMELPFKRNIKCSNFVGDTIDMAVDMGVKGILFVAHIGKFVKVAAGIMNTHSHNADGRMEVLAASAIRAGADMDCAKEILDCNTTDEALDVLDKHQILPETMAVIMEKIQFYLNHRSYNSAFAWRCSFFQCVWIFGADRKRKIVS